MNTNIEFTHITAEFIRDVLILTHVENLIQNAGLTHPYTYLGILSFLISSLFGVYTLKRRETRSNIAFSGFVFALAIWGLSNTVQLVLDTPEIKEAFVYIMQLSAVSTVLFWFLFASLYTKQDIPTRYYLTRSIPAFALLTTIIAGIFTPEIWGTPVARITEGATVYDMPDTSENPILTVSAITMYAYALSGIGKLVLNAREHANKNKRQYNFLVISGLVLLLGGVISMFELHPHPEIEVVPYVFTVSMMFIWWAVYGYDFLNILPVARAKVVSGMHQSVFVVDDENKIIDANNSATKLANTEMNDMRDKDLFSFLPEIKRLGDGSFTEQNIYTDFKYRVDDETKYFNVRVSPLYTRSQYAGAILTFDDVTKQKDQQEALEQQKIELEMQKKELERQNNQLEQFASVLSHDLRNPLNMAQGYLDLAQKNPENDQYFKNANKGLDRMDNMIDDLLTLAQQGQSVEETQDVDLADLAKDSWGMLEFASAGLSVETDMHVEADKGRLRNVFENLYRNSVDHSEEGTDTEILVGELDNETGFFIEDNGPGIPEDKRDEVFGQGVTYSDDGTGFGLSIVEQVAEAHGWTVSIADGETLGGARFEFTLTDPDN